MDSVSLMQGHVQLIRCLWRPVTPATDAQDAGSSDQEAARCGLLLSAVLPQHFTYHVHTQTQVCIFVCSKFGCAPQSGARQAHLLCERAAKGPTQAILCLRASARPRAAGRLPERATPVLRRRQHALGQALDPRRSKRRAPPPGLLACHSKPRARLPGLQRARRSVARQPCARSRPAA